MARGLYDFFSRKGFQIDILSDVSTKDLHRPSLKAARVFLEFPQVLARAIHFKPDIFFTYHLHHQAPDPLSPMLAKALRKPFFIYEAFSPETSSPIHHLPSRFINQMSFKIADHIFTDKMLNNPQLLDIVSAEKITYIPPSIDLSLYEKSSPDQYTLRQELGIPKEEIIISSVAMLRPGNKTESVQFLIECLSELRQEGLSFTYIHAGGGKNLNKITQQAQSNLKEKYHILGTLSSNKVRRVFSESDLFAFPGINEDFGLVYLEAQASQLPIVAFDNEGIAESVLKEQSAFLTPLMKKKPYKEALKKLILNSDLRYKMGKSGLNYILNKHNRLKNYELILERIQQFT